MSDTEPRGSDAEIVALLRACGMDEANLVDGVRNVRKIVRAKTMAARDTEPLDLDRIEALANAATPGPWWGGGDRQSRNAYGLVGRTADRGTGNAIAVLSGTDMDRVADAEFIASARTDVPALIAEVRRLREETATSDGLSEGSIMFGGYPGFIQRLRLAASIWAKEHKALGRLFIEAANVIEDLTTNWEPKRRAK